MYLNSYKNRRYFPVTMLLVWIAYLFVGGFQNHRATDTQKTIAHARGHVVEKGRVIPNLLGLSEWRSLYISNGMVYADFIKTPFKGESCYWSGIQRKLYDLQEFQRKSAPPLDVLEDFEAFNWFSDWFLFKISEKPLKVWDMRFILEYDPLQTPFVMQFPTRIESGQAELIQMKTDGSLLLTFTFGPLEKKMSQCRKI